MKVLVLGPSGTGKTYVSHALQSRGINAFDADDIQGLSAWYNQQVSKVPPPTTVEEAITNQYSFLWSKAFLAAFLQKFTDIYVFGGSGNVFSMFDLFDKVYFLKAELALQKQRLRSPLRKQPLMDMKDDDIVVWGGWFEEQAKKHNIPFVDASLSPEQVFGIISQ